MFEHIEEPFLLKQEGLFLEFKIVYFVYIQTLSLKFC